MGPLPGNMPQTSPSLHRFSRTRPIGRSSLASLLVAVATLACTPAQNDPGDKGGSSGGASGTGGKGSGGAASGGASGEGGGSGGNPAAASGGSPGASGGGTGTGGFPGGAGGGSGSGGASPGSGGGGGASDADRADMAAAGGGVAIAGMLHKHLSTVKCVRQQSDGKSCFAGAADENRTTAITFGGDAAVTYDVKLHVRGLVEPRGYTGGMLQDPVNVWFYVGGIPGGPQDDNRYGSYQIATADPKQVYYLNRDDKNILHSPQNHNLFKLDYVVTLKIKGGSMVQVIVADAKGSGMINNWMKNRVDGIPEDVFMQPATGFDGQFIYLEVDAVTPGN
jgi:hypothetical protein